MSDLKTYEAGTRDQNGKYCRFIESPDEKAVEEYIKTMNIVVPDDYEIVLFENSYQLSSTVPRIVRNKDKL